MGALQYLRQHGLTANPVEGNRLEVSPACALDDELRAWVREHKSELMEELMEPRRHWWWVRLDGVRVGKICAQPMTQTEALTSCKAIWPTQAVEIER